MKAAKFAEIVLILLVSPVSPSHARPPVDPTPLTVCADAVPMLRSVPRVAIDLYEIDIYDADPRSHSSVSPTITCEFEPKKAGAGTSDNTAKSTGGVEIQVHWMNYLPCPNVLYTSVQYTVVLTDWPKDVTPDNSGIDDGRSADSPRAELPSASKLPDDVAINVPVPAVVPAVDVYDVEVEEPKTTPEIMKPRTTPLASAGDVNISAPYFEAGLPESSCSVGAAVSLAKLTIVPTLAQNRPNPFNPATEIEFYLPCACHVELAVFNVGLDRICTLLHETREAGTHRVIWDGTDDHGAKVASGIYLYRLEAARHAETKEMILLK